MARYNNRRPVSQYKDDYMSTGKWIMSFILLAIPGINVIAFLVWLFGGGKNNSRTNFIRASLLLSIILSIIAVVIYFVLDMSFAEISSSISDWVSNFLP